MKKNNNSLLLTIMGGAIFCFVFLGMAFIFTNNTKVMKGNNSTNDEINLGDTGTCSNSSYHGDTACASVPCSSITNSSDCTRYKTTDNLHSCCGWSSSRVCWRLNNNACSSAVVSGTSCTTGYYSTLSDCKSNIECDAGYKVKSDGSGCEEDPESIGTLTCKTVTYNGQEQVIATCNNCAIVSVNGSSADAGSYSATNVGTYTIGASTAGISLKFANGLTTASCTAKIEGACPAGQGADSSASSGCSNCAAGYYSPANDNTCHQCPEGQTSTAGSESCKSEIEGTCPAGQGADSSASSGCSNCAAGYYSPANDNTCHPCETGKTSRAGSESCNITITAPCCVTESTGSKTTYTDLTACKMAFQNHASVVLGSCEGLASLDGGGSAYVTPTANKTFYIHAIGVDGKVMSNVTWTVTPSNAAALASQNCSGANCVVVVKAWGCSCTPPTATIRVTAKENGSTRTASTNISVTSYGEWRLVASGVTGDVGSLTLTTALDHATCTGYNNYNPATGKYDKYNRCCCGGGSTPTPPACYQDTENNEYHWTSSPNSSWKKIEEITKEDDCKETEDDACYKDPTGQYKWGKYAKTTGYTKITSITDSALCQTPTEDEACYRKDNDYVWSATAPEGYSKVEGVTKPEDCVPEETPACYVHGNEFVWGKYDKVTGYIKLEEIDSETECKLPEDDACYVDKDGNYVWGRYADDSDYTLVPSVTEMSQCKSDVPVPATGINVSKLVYIFMAILMACGVGFIYYSSVAKKNS